MMLLPNWKDILKRAWSVKSNVALVVVGVLQSVFAIYGDPLLGAALSGAVMALFGSASLLLRVMAQKEAEALIEGTGNDPAK